MSEETRATPITSDAKRELRVLFEACNFARNQKFPRANVIKELDDLIEKYKLNRGQASRQFLNWKKEKFDFELDTFSTDPEEIRQLLNDHMVQDPEEFVGSVMQSMIPTTESAGIENYRWLTMLCQERPKFLDAVKLISKQPYIAPFVRMLGDYTDIAVAVFPNTAKLLKKAENKFLQGRKDFTVRRREEFQVMIISRRALHEMANERSELVLQNLNNQEWAALFNEVEDKMYRQWALASYSHGLPPIEIPLEVDVHNGSKGVLYYTAGWILSKIPSSKRGNDKFEKKFRETFAKHLSITYEEAERNSLPMQLVKKREMKSLTYPNETFYTFIALLETIYMKNLTTTMMIAYSDGKLLHRIHQAIFVNAGVRAIFIENFDLENVEYSWNLLHRILSNFRNMRGRWFVSSLHGQKRKTLRVVDNFATRKGVANAAAVAKGKAEARAESTKCEYYESATESLLEVSLSLGDDGKDASETEDELNIESEDESDTNDGADEDES
jgi:hypothetical protein